MPRRLRTAAEATSASAPPKFDPTQQVGITAPLGFFDPAGFCNDVDEETFRGYRAAEIKHGRVAMMASAGAVLQHVVRFPGFENEAPGLKAAVGTPGMYGFAALFIISGVLEVLIWQQSDSKEPGNFGDPLGLGMYDTEMRNKEINNGRMAMFASLGIVAADLATGMDGIEQL